MKSYVYEPFASYALRLSRICKGKCTEDTRLGKLYQLLEEVEGACANVDIDFSYDDSIYTDDSIEDIVVQSEIFEDTDMSKEALAEKLHLIKKINKKISKLEGGV